MKLPNFLFVGADKCGSTWLSEVLRQHPRCFVPRAKDIYFFDRYYDRGLDWYARFFASAPDDVIATGELSHDYLYSDVAAARIVRDLPGVRLIVFLRDPAERCFSEYLYLVRSGITRRPFWDAIHQFPDILDHSRYARHVRRYLDSFPADRVGVFFYEDLQADAQRFAARILEFLGLDLDEAVDTARHPLAAARPRSVLLARLARESAQIARRHGFPGIVGRVKSSQLASALYISYQADERPRLDPADRASLLKVFSADVVALRELLRTDIPRWLIEGET